jgi:hypothetical protein
MTPKQNAKEHPILFCGEMVQAIFGEKKTQTRRVVTRANCDTMPKHLWDRLVFDDDIPAGAPRAFADDGYLHIPTQPHPEDCQDGDWWTMERVYPRWRVGDRLWVRETLFMPRRLSRLTLELVDVRGQRLWDISEADAEAEGVERREHFIRLWDSLNEKRGCGWAKNLWVWAISFRVVKGEA